MITVDFQWSPRPLSGEPDYRPIGDAMNDAAETFAKVLQGALSGAVLPGMTGPVSMDKPSVTYQTLGEMEFTVTGPDVSKIEEGIKPWDMKPGLLHGPKHRVSKDGTLYNIVPFNHDRKNLSGSVAAMADQLETSAIIGKYIDELGVTRNVYRWGESRYGMWKLPDMPNSSLLSINVSKTGYVHKTSRYSGMVKMSGNKLMTFRTVSEKSPPESWWNPGKPGNPVTESVWNAMMPSVEAHIQEAWEKVFETWLFSPNGR